MEYREEVKFSVRQYLSSFNCFTIPAYQRGYKWGVQKRGMQGHENDASILVQDIINAYLNNTDEYFIQGVTVYKDLNKIILIDGQQRTTTLFLLLNILLNSKESDGLLWSSETNEIKLEYKIRKTSQEYLSYLILPDKDLAEEDSQDIYYMKQAKQYMKDKIEILIGNSEDPDKEKQDFTNYILDNVKLFFIVVNKNQANSVFSLMNGARALMKTDELIKANFLIKASNKQGKAVCCATKDINDTLDILRKQIEFQIANEWDVNTIRSRYARMWDRWMYWWRQESVRMYFHCGDNPMGLLLQYFYDKEHLKDVPMYSNDPEDLPSVFKSFSNTFISDPLKAILQFEELRKFQKKFEDLYNNSHTYNYLGYSLAVLNEEDRRSAINFALEHHNDDSILCYYARLASIGCSSKEIEHFLNEGRPEDKAAALANKIQEMIEKLSENDVYNNNVNPDGRFFAFRQLYRLNVQEQDRFGKFDFTFYDEKKKCIREMYDARSLEHIWPKSRVVVERSDGTWFYYKNDETVESNDATNLHGYLKVRNSVSENKAGHNSIGNMAFLNIIDNIYFRHDVPEEKKQKLFTLKEKIYSRNCPHTIAAFAKDHWSEDNALTIISNRKSDFIEKMKEDFKFVTNIQ